MLNAIILGLLRHVLSSVGAALAASSVQLVAGSPVIHNLGTAVVGGVMVVGGMVLSTVHKVKTESGPIYKTN